MDTEVIIGFVFLGLALPLTLAVVVILLRIIVISGAILGLANRTLAAAQGIAVNTRAIANLGTTEKVVGGILSTVQAMDEVSASIERKLGAVASAVERRG